MITLRNKKSSLALRMRNAFSPKLSTHSEYSLEFTPPVLPTPHPQVPELRGSSTFNSNRLTKSRRPTSESYPPAYSPPIREERIKLKPGDTPTSRAKGQKITAKEIRELRELIRYRYHLDVEIWSLRDVDYWDRDAVTEKQKKSMAALRKIQATVLDWDKREYFSNEHEYMKMQEIRNKVLEGGKRNWNEEPAWAELERRG